MKPTKKTTTITIEYWDCGCCDTKHKTKKSAEDCISKHNPTKPKLTDKEYKKQHILRAVEAVKTGSFTDASKNIGASKEAIKRSLYKVLRLARSESRLLRSDDSRYFDIVEIRKDPDYWMSQIALIAKKWKVKI